VKVESLNDEVAWLTIEGSVTTHNAQFWFSTYGLTESQVNSVHAR